MHTSTASSSTDIVSTSPQSDPSHLIWIDLEMTGLDPQRDRIIEIATIITDSNLTILAEGPVIAIHQSEAQLALMDEWNVTTHTRTGLIERVRKSTFNEAMAEQMTLDFIRQWVPENCSPICGNTIGQDRRFLCQYMSDLERYFHYRYLDVSTIKELAHRWKPELLTQLTKKGTHQALDDIRDSIDELRFYRTHFFTV